MSENGKKPTCRATTKAGKPCRSYALAGGQFCLSHSDKETRAKLCFGGPENGAKGGEAKRVPRLTEVLTKRVEERADEIMDKLFSMLDAQRAVVVGTGPKARVETVPDDDLALKAIREIYDRFEGRPKQATEITGKDGGPITLHPPADAEERSVTAARVLERARAQEAASSNGHG